MLVISRKVGEEICIDGTVTIRVLGVDPRGAVRLGIEAPRTVAVHRRELYERLRQLNVQAARRELPEVVAQLRSARLYRIAQKVKLPAVKLEP